ncbi:NAD-dependent epimerase/dehydratase family protein [Oculatella sp. FACHB-28]|uniref:NAD-dependent epimerase/dehydratase family protein n=1 Tax=Oculatella sp. FACHB-28 TaxID=2692845 RepID=UPI001689E5DD|nr:NAD-dependent epimerase/dehydratase family protein [Oculatella sp. FACHB-28]MBD2057028.1 NAD-dependent epimerase/dehydratase family protein [Oculatella sp. FACHB-28]
MQIFVTGATGYIGRVVTEQALAEGHDVYGLSRNEAGDAQLKALGAIPVRGDLASLDILRQQSSEANAVLHLAYIHDWSMDYEEILQIDGAAVGALGEPLHGTEKALVVTSGTAVVDSDPAGNETTEDSPLSQIFVLKERIRSERHALSLSERGVRVSAIRLPPYVHGRGGSYFVPLLMQMAAKAGESIYVDDGSLCTSAVHVDDAATLYLLAAKAAKAGNVFNGTGSTTVTLRALAEAIAAALDLPVRSVSREEAEMQWGQFLTAFVQFEN